MNKMKCGILQQGPSIIAEDNFFEIPVVKSYKYLGIVLSTSTKQIRGAV
jgi:hypothetical protein